MLKHQDIIGNYINMPRFRISNPFRNIRCTSVCCVTAMPKDEMEIKEIKNKEKPKRKIERSLSV